MDTIKWTEELSVGVAQFDEQHKRLINLINRLIRKQNSDELEETVSEVLNELIQYTMEHFESEEILMEKYNYPELEAHKSQHHDLLEKVVGFCEARGINDTGVPDKLLAFLREWLSRHILEEDMAYKDFFVGQGIS